MSAIRLLVALACALAVPVPSQALTVSIDLSVGEIEEIGQDANLSPVDLSAFLVGESLLFRLAFDDGAVDTNTKTGEGRFSTDAILSFIGQTSGTVLAFSQDLLIETKDDKITFETGEPTPAQPFAMKDDLEIKMEKDFFSDPDSLAQVLAELTSINFEDDKSDSVKLEFHYLSGGKTKTADAFQFDGTVASASMTPPPLSAVAAVPIPGTLALALLAMSALGAMKLRLVARVRALNRRVVAAIPGAAKRRGPLAAT